jgi:hypothetical protein
MRKGAILVFLLAAAIDAAADLTPGTPVPVRILYDNSGSMYAGYQPPGAADRRTRAELGAAFFHESPAFAAWLDEFVKRQTIVDAGTVGMWTFTSGDRFTPDDIREVHRAVPVAEFDVETAIGNFPEHAGASTYLTETLQSFTRDFTGVVWLITDNIVETQEGQPDAGVQRFFDTLKTQPEFRSVHLFKYPIEEGGRSAALAVYAIVVSNGDVPTPALAYYDGKFRTLREARQAGGTDLFPGREYLKLKDLQIEPMRPDLRLVLDSGENGTFKEGRTVHLKVEGEIRSYLTQHSVTGGRYELAVASPFVAEDWAQRGLGAQPLVAEVFDAVSGEIREPIPPGGARNVQAELQSTQPVTFTPRGIGDWLRLAWSGATVRYSATARMAFTDVQVRLEPQQMAGIFGIDQASSIFKFQDITTLPRVQPTLVPVTFALRAGSSRSGILLALFALLLTLLGVAAFLLSRAQVFRIAISGTPERIAALRRLGRQDVTFDGKLLGRLSRGFVNGYAFDPVRGDAALTVVPASEPDTWDLRLTGGALRRLSIKTEGGGTAKARSKPTPAARAAPPPPPPLPSSKSVPPRPPRVGRN